MQLTRGTYKAIAATVVAIALAMPAAAVCERLWVVDHELWSSEGDQARLVINDVRGVLHPRFSPTGDRIVYAHDFRFDHGPQSEIVVAAATGEVLASLEIPDGSAVNAILQVGWRGDRRVYAEGHVNPSTTKYFEWDLPSGRLVEEKPGSWFSVSPDGRFVAQLAHVPHGAPPPHDSATLLINDKVAYPPEGDTAYHRFAGGVAWSPDSSRIALLERHDDTASVVVVTPGKAEITRTPVAATAGPAELSWSGPNSVIIRSGEEEWRVDAKGGSAVKASARSVAAKSAPAPPALRDRARGVPRAEDVRCKD